MSGKLFSIVCNGRPIDNGLLKKYVADSDTVIASDAGLLYLQKIDIRPDVFIGDLDSLDIPADKIDAGEVIVYDSEKDQSDTELAVQYAIEKGAEKILLLCAAGRRIDHLLANIALLTRYPGRLIMVDDEFSVFALTSETGAVNLKMIPGNMFSVFCYGGKTTGLYETGSHWELENITLIPGSLGLSNEAVSGEVGISIETGTLIVFAECGVNDIYVNV